MTLEEAWEAHQTEVKKRVLKRAGWKCINGSWELPVNEPQKPLSLETDHLGTLTTKFASKAFREAFNGFCEHRGKSMTPRSKKMILKKINAECRSERHAIHTLNLSVERGWKGVFPPTALKDLEQQDRDNVRVAQVTKETLPPMPADFPQWAEDNGYDTTNLKQLWAKPETRKKYNQ